LAHLAAAQDLRVTVLGVVVGDDADITRIQVQLAPPGVHDQAGAGRAERANEIAERGKVA